LPMFEDSPVFSISHRDYYQVPGSGGCEMRGTMFWHPSLSPTESDLYMSLKAGGFRPVYMRTTGKSTFSVSPPQQQEIKNGLSIVQSFCRLDRGNTTAARISDPFTEPPLEFGQTWYCGYQPVHVYFFKPCYGPQIPPRYSRRAQVLSHDE